jgi:hypothetical protein
VHGASAFLSIGTEGYGIPVLEAIRLGTPVLYDGIQPAADVMAGRGATRVAGLAHDDLAAVFARYSTPAHLAELSAGLSPDAVPTWAAFALAVADAVKDQVTG